MEDAVKDEERETRESVEVPHPNNTAVGHLYAAKAELSALAHEAGRGPAGRCYSIVLTDLEKLIHVEAGFFPRDVATDHPDRPTATMTAGLPVGSATVEGPA